MKYINWATVPFEQYSETTNTMNWGKTFIKKYTETEKESLQLLVSEIFKQNLLVDLKPNLLEQICRIWWMVLGSFGNTALYGFVLSDQEFSKKICDDAGIDYGIFIETIKRLKINKVAELARREEDAYQYIMFLMFSMVNIFTDLIGASFSEILMVNNPNPELLSRFYKKTSEIMNRGGKTWQDAVATDCNETFRKISREYDK